MGAVLAGHYHVIKPLGRGGFGQTFLARDSHLPGRPLCVVKQLKPGLNTPETLKIAKRLFDLEAEVLYRLGNHDQIPRLLAHFDQDGEFYLVQEYIDGWSLDQELAQRRLTEPQIIALLHDVLMVLAFVHDQGVIHRDIKPSNLMRRRTDRKIILIDFGAVKQVGVQSLDRSGQTSFTVAIGSSGYMPVEQQSSLPHFSSDIYAAGMVALQAFTGLLPRSIPKDDQGEIRCEQLDTAISLELAALLNKMVRFDYRQRYAHAREALEAIATLQQGASHLTAHPPLHEPAKPTPISPPANTGYPDQTLPHAGTFDPDQTLSHANTFDHADNHADGHADDHANTFDQDQTLPPDLSTIPQSSLPSSLSSFSPSFPPSLKAASQRTVSHPFVDRSPASGRPVLLAPPALSRQEYRNRQALLNKVKNYWIKGVLENSLHDQVVIDQGVEDRSDAIASPWNIALETPLQSAQTLPHGTQIINIFDDLGVGRSLLILGEPGAGKTTTLLQLARDLITRAEQDLTHLIPVVLNLSSWSPAKASIAAWIVDELNAKYQIPKKISAPWVHDQQLLLLLDGLDEVRSPQREACVQALNAFQQQHSTEMVVCSRISDYEALSQRLNVQSAIYLRSLTPTQIQHYLDRLSPNLTGLRTLLADDPTLQELARSPLMLNIMVLVYQGVAAEDVRSGLVVEERRQQLFNAYVEQMFKRRATLRPYSEQQAITWLSWLAQRLIQQSHSVFLIEQIQPDWLSTKGDRRCYRIGVAFMGVLMGAPFGLITGLMTNGLTYGWRSGLIKGVINGLIFGLVFGLIAGFSQPEVATVETLKWSWREVRQRLWVGLKNGFPLGILAGLIFALASQLIPHFALQRAAQVTGSSLMLGLLTGFTAGTSGGLIYGLTGGLRGSTIETKTIPNQGMRRTLRSAAISGAIGGLADLAFITILYGAIFGWRYGLIYGFSYGLFGGAIAGFLFGGGQACFKHLMLRLILFKRGHIPWNYSQFLNSMAEHAFLQKVGGGYLFIHRLLLEHFAQL